MLSYQKEVVSGGRTIIVSDIRVRLLRNYLEIVKACGAKEFRVGWRSEGAGEHSRRDSG